jgi:hypothetical protein
MGIGTIPVPGGTMIRVSVQVPGPGPRREAQLIWMSVETMSLDQANEQIKNELLRRLMSETAK